MLTLRKNNDNESLFQKIMHNTAIYTLNEKSRKLLEIGGDYLVNELALEANNSSLGYSTVAVPFSSILSYLPSWMGGNPIRYVTGRRKRTIQTLNLSHSLKFF